MKKLLLLSFIFSTHSLSAQQRGEDKFLPNYTTMQEALGLYDAPPTGEGDALPPPTKPRAMAEWEELQGLAVAWQFYNNTAIKNILIEIIRNARKELTVMIVCNDSTALKSCKADLLAKNVDITSNISFIPRASNSIWIRDYGPNAMYINDVDTLNLVDWIYNRPRPADDALSVGIANFNQIPAHYNNIAPEDLVHTGGNFMSDGLGTAFSSNLVLTENDAIFPNGSIKTSIKTETDINAIVAKYLGINRYIKMPVLPYDEIHHIDMHMKLLDEETLIVGEYPTGVSDGPQIEANLQYVLANFKTPYGNPYRVIRIPMPPQNNKYPNEAADYRTYTNMVFVNKTVLVPTYELKYDTTALRILKASLLGYNVVGINCNAIITYLGAIHCITKEIGVASPLWITHEKVKDRPNYQGENIFTKAQIKHKSGIKNASIFWRKRGDISFKNMQLSKNMSNDEWLVYFPTNLQSGTYEYYIAAAANSGKTITRPLTAQNGGYYSFTLDAVVSNKDTKEVVAPSLRVFPNPSNQITCVEINTAKSGVVCVEMTNMLGQNIKTFHNGMLQAGTNRFFFQANEFDSGVYFVRVKTNEGEKVEKILIR